MSPGLSVRGVGSTISPFTEKVLAALKAKRQGKDARFGPTRTPSPDWPDPLKVLTPAEGGDGKEMPRVAVHS